MSFIANSLQFGGDGLATVGGKRAAGVIARAFPKRQLRNGEGELASHLDVGHPVFVLVHGEVGFCRCTERGS